MGGMKVIYLTLALLLACTPTVETETLALEHCDETWYIVEWPLAKTHHTGDSCPTEGLGLATYTIKQPCAEWPLAPVVNGDPLWDCEWNALHEEVRCGYLFDEDVVLVNMSVKYDEYLEFWFDDVGGGICYYVFKPYE
jgi:hypothetical protein